MEVKESVRHRVDETTKKNARNRRDLHHDDYDVYRNHGMLNGMVAGPWYTRIRCAAIDGPGALQRRFDDCGNSLCCVEILHLEGWCYCYGRGVKDRRGCAYCLRCVFVWSRKKIYEIRERAV